VELRQAPLISESIRWCSNLAAPDMLFNWSFLWPEWFNRGNGMFALGPYFNLLPVLTIVIFLWQQKRMMPPPADEQAAVQQKVMNFMMIFMGILFYKVPSGLCLYFIVSSLWSMAEREILLKTVKRPDGTKKPKRDWKKNWQKIQDSIPDWLKELIKAADKRYAEKMPREKLPPAKRTRV
jgi:YidC/Oxa1 family membrane protein insertase